MQVERQWQQGSANDVEVSKLWEENQSGEEQHRNTGGKQENTENTGEQEIEKGQRHKRI